MTRKVLVSPGFGAGWATWNKRGKELAEDAALVALVEKGEHLGACTYGDVRRAGVNIADCYRAGNKIEASLAFVLRAVEVMGGEVPYCGGVDDLVVREVSGPYRIDEYDGSESLVESSGQEWW